jgi:hypothetical protein
VLTVSLLHRFTLTFMNVDEMIVTIVDATRKPGFCC